MNPQEDKTEQLRQTWKHHKWLPLLPLGLVVLFIIYFALVSNEGVPAEDNVEERQAIIETKEVFLNDIQAPSASLEEVEVVRDEPRQWPDGCLGLGGEDEFCTQAVQDGYEITVKYTQDDTTYRGTYRTNELGSAVRQENLTVVE